MVDTDAVQREKLLENVLNTLDKVGVKLDVSLHNAVLKVTNMKSNNFDITIFPFFNRCI